MLEAEGRRGVQQQLSTVPVLFQPTIGGWLLSTWGVLPTWMAVPGSNNAPLLLVAIMCAHHARFTNAVRPSWIGSLLVSAMGAADTEIELN